MLTLHTKINAKKIMKIKIDENLFDDHRISWTVVDVKKIFWHIN